jgi:hypothetical protein
MTVITVIDRPCGIGKTTDLINYLKNLKKHNIKEKILIVVPELGEVERFINALGIDYFETPIVDTKLVKQGFADNKTDVLINILSRGQNAIITHALYERIRQFEHLLTDYCVIIDEVPAVAKQVRTMFGSGVFKKLLYDKKYISIDPNTKLITSTGHWMVDELEYCEGSDIGISKFMKTIQSADVYYIKGNYCVMPLPDAFFTRPKSLTILTFLFTGTQLDYYMRKRGYSYLLQTCMNELAQFKKQMNANLKVFHKTTDISTGYLAMTSKPDKSRKKVGNFVKNSIQLLKKNGLGFGPEMILVASSKDAWYGKEENPNSNVSNATSLKRLTRLGKVPYTSMITRGTNKFKDRNVLINMGKVNINNDLAEFLGMNTKIAKDRHTLSELVQLIYRTGIRDGKDTFFISADADNIRVLKEFM